VRGRKFFPVKNFNNTYHQGTCLMHQGEKNYVLLFTIDEDPALVAFFESPAEADTDFLHLGSV